MSDGGKNEKVSPTEETFKTPHNSVKQVAELAGVSSTSQQKTP